MLRLPPFRFRIAASLEEAAELLAGEGPKTRLVAGGTDLWPNMKRRVQMADTVVSLMRIPELREIRAHADGALTLGATRSLRDLAADPAVMRHFPTLATALRSISAPALRNMGTLGGNLCLDTRCTYYNQSEEWRRSIDYCMKEEGSVCWVAPSSPRCWAVASGDSAPVLCALGARVRLASRGGQQREIPVTELFRDDGIDFLAKRPEEILTAVVLPGGSTAERCRSAFWKLRRRGGIDFAVLTVAVALWMEGKRVARASIYLGAVGSRPLLAEDACQALVGRTPSPERLAEAAALARRVATPLDNTDFKAQWRSVMVERYTEAALREAVGLPTDRLAPRHGLGAA